MAWFITLTRAEAHLNKASVEVNVENIETMTASNLSANETIIRMGSREIIVAEDIETIKRILRNE